MKPPSAVFANPRGWNIESDPRASALRRALQHVETHLAEPLTLERIAAVAHYSPHHFHRLFRRFTGESLMAYLRRLRLEQAAYEFRLGTKAIGHTAMGLGFQTHEAFTRRFNAAFGTTPRAYATAAHGTVRAAARGPSERIQSLEVVHFPGARCLAKRIRGGYRHLTPPNRPDSPWHTLAHAADAQLGLPEVECYGVCWDDPLITDEPFIRYDACLALAGRAFDSYSGETVDIASGRYARGTWRGTIQEMTDDYHYLLYEWPKAHRRTVDSDRPPFERFRVAPRRDPLGSAERSDSQEATYAEIFIPLC